MGPHLTKRGQPTEDEPHPKSPGTNEMINMNLRNASLPGNKN